MASAHSSSMSATQPPVDWGRCSSGLSVVVPVSPSDQHDPRSADALSASSSPAVLSPLKFGHDADVPVAGPSNTVKAGRTPSRYDWTKHMDTIKRLYIDEDKTLKEVLEIMEREHNFIATPRMVKTRLKKWGYTKNVSVKSGEVEALMGLIFDAESQGDVRRNATEVRLATGRVVGLDRIAAHLRRKKIPPSVMQKASSSCKQVSLARYRDGDQSLPSPIGTSIDTPGVFRVSESIFRDLHTYVTAHSGSPYQNSLVQSNILTGQDKAVYDLVITARNFVVKDKMAEAAGLLRKAPEHIKALLDSNSTNIPRCLFLLFINLLEVPRAERLNPTTQALIKYVAALASDISLGWPVDHPLRRVILSLNQASGDELREILIRGYKCILLSFECLPDPSARYRTFAAWLDLGNAAGFEALPLEALEASLEKDHQNAMSAAGSTHNSPVQQLSWMAELERQKVKVRGIPNTRLKKLYNMTLSACQDDHSTTAAAAKVNCTYYMAGIYHDEGERVLAEANMRMTIEQCFKMQIYGTAASVSTELQAWLAEWGEQSKVDDIQLDITNQMSNLGLDPATLG